MPDTSRPNPDTVCVRVLEKGHDRVSTGQYDETARAFTKFASGEEFHIARDIADALVERGFVTILCDTSHAPVHDTTSPRIIVPMPDDPAQRANWSHFARERLARHAEREADTGCLVWRGARTANGYGGITYLGKTYTAHRLAWLAHQGPIPSDLRVCHVCDNRLCLELSHLFLGTPQQNTIDMIRKGRGRGFGHRNRLDENKVASIKRRLQAGESVSALAAEMSVSINTIGDIKRGRTWFFVEPK